MTDAIVLDTPEQINHWVFASAISQLALEVKLGINTSSRGSVLKGIQARGWTSVTGRATRRNKLLTLAELLHEQPSSPVVDLARRTLAEACEADGIQIVPVAG